LTNHPAPIIVGVTDAATPGPAFFKRLTNGRTLLGLGIILRIFVFIFLAPLNNDTGHLYVIKYIVERHGLPAAKVCQMCFQPPLYYLAAAPFYRIIGNAKGVQVLSLALSILTLLIFFQLLYREDLVGAGKPRLYAFALTCLLPQFVLFGLYVSNDSLAIFLGALMILQVARFAADPSGRQLLLLALIEGLGLLTKGTFLAFLPVLFVLALFLRLRKSESLWRAALAGLALLLLSCGLGSYRYVRNYQELKNPFVIDANFNYSWVGKQQQSYRGAASFFDVNFLNLLASPTVDPRKPTGTPIPSLESSYPLLLFGSFWYPLIQESNFAVSRASFNYLGSVIYVLALVPLAVFFVGLLQLSKGLWRFLARFELSRKEDQRMLVSLVSVLFLFGNLGLLVMMLLRYHIWSVATGRLLFPAFCGLVVPFGIGTGMTTRHKGADAALKLAMLGLAACFGLYFGFEILHKLLYQSCFVTPYCG
jgi:4-amino-4-deoxy-L-arabinose transferase-like glycosyltransferase